MKDPTETSSIRQAWIRQLNTRFRKLRGRVNTLFTQGKIPFDSEFLVFFAAWFDREIRGLFGGNWQRKYIEEAYTKGLLTSGFIQGVNGSHMDAIDAIHQQVKVEIETALAAMKSQASEEIQRGLAVDLSKKDMAGLVKDRINKIGNTRAAFVANTKTPYAANFAKVRAAQISGNGDVEFLWVTRQDERVRTGHALRNRRIYSQKAAMNLIGEPGCRCSIVAVTKDEKAPKGYKEIRRQGIAISEQAQRERKFYATLRRGERAEGLNGVL